MKYGKIVSDGFILAVTTGGGTEITEEEYNEILAAVQSAPASPEGFVYKLRADTLEWELVELPPEPEPELSDEEALSILLGGDGE